MYVYFTRNGRFYSAALSLEARSTFMCTQHTHDAQDVTRSSYCCCAGDDALYVVLIVHNTLGV